MSLINEALKKAQRQRMAAPVEVPPTSPGAPAAHQPRILKRRPPMSASTQILLLGGGGALLVMACVFVFLFLWPEEPALPARPTRVAVQPAPPVVAVATPVAPAPPAAEPPAPVPAPLPATPPTAPVEPMVTLPTVTPSTPPPLAPPPPVSTPVAVNPLPLPSPSATPTPASTASTPVATSTTPVPNPKVYEFLEALRISGIRVSATDPKVIMNDRVFRLNDVVDRATQLRLMRVESGLLTFTDAGGFEYRKSF